MNREFAYEVALWVAAVVVIVGNVFGVTAIVSIREDWVSMKPTTASCFALSAVALRFVRIGNTRRASQVGAMIAFTMTAFLGFRVLIDYPIAIVMLGVALATLALAVGSTQITEASRQRAPAPVSWWPALGGIGLALALSAFRVGSGEEIHTEAPGEPSLGTILSFLTFSIWLRNRGRAWPAILIEFVATVAVFGYVFDSSALTWRVEGTSTGMALHTAVLFCLVARTMHRRVGEWKP